MANELSLLTEFEKILNSYHMSEHAEEVLKKTKLVLLVAPTSAGRNTIINELLKTGGYHYIVSDTTRQPRVNNGVPEQDGHEYWFRSEAQVLDELQHGEFLEAAIIHNQQVSGISIRELEQAANDGKFAITDIETVGTDNIHRVKPDVLAIYILPPNFQEWLQRLLGRGELSAGELSRRLHSARQELDYALTKDYYFFVVNNTVAEAAAEVDNIVHDPTPNPARGDKARTLAQKLCRDLDDYFAAHPESLQT